MRKVITLIMLLLMTLIFALPSFGAERRENTAPGAGVENLQGQAIQRMAMANRLIELGRSQKSPLMLASAAQILRDVRLSEEAHERAGVEIISFPERATSYESNKESDSRDVTSESLYAEAIAMAKEAGDPVLVEIIEKDSRIGASKASVVGPRTGSNRLRAYTNDTYYVRFRGGERAWIRVVGDGDPTAVFVYDEYSNLVAKDDDWHTISEVSWTPRWTGDFAIIVKNRIGVYVDYTLVTN